ARSWPDCRPRRQPPPLTCREAERSGGGAERRPSGTAGPWGAVEHGCLGGAPCVKGGFGGTEAWLWLSRARPVLSRLHPVAVVLILYHLAFRRDDWAFTRMA